MNKGGENNLTSKIIAIILIVVFGTFLLLTSNYFDCRKIVINYLKLFKIHDGKFNIILFLVCNVLPIALGLTGSFKMPISGNIMNNVIVIITILVSVFLALIGVVIDIGGKIRSLETDATDMGRLMEIVKQTRDILMFEFLLSIILLLIAFCSYLKLINTAISSVLIYSLTIAIFLNLFIMLKEISFLLDRILE